MERLWDVRNNGFLPTDIRGTNEHEALREHEQVFEMLPDLLGEERRHRLADLPLVKIVFDYESFDVNSSVLIEDEAGAEALFQLFAMLASAYVQACSEEFTSSQHQQQHHQQQQHQQQQQQQQQRSARLPVVLPATLAVPLKVLSSRVRRLPITDYAACVLCNWELIDNTKPLSLENVRILRTFTRLRSEEWFYMIHVVIEHHAVDALRAIDAVQSVALQGCNFEDDNEFRAVEIVIASVERIERALKTMNKTLGRMGEHCKGHDFYNVIRPWLSSWPSPGVVYASADSSDLEPESYSGGSGAQSSIMPALDTFFGVRHGIGAEGESAEDHQARERFAAALRRYRDYMPAPHRDFLESLERSDTLRDYIRGLEEGQAQLLHKSRDKKLPIVVCDQYRFKSTNLARLVQRLKWRYNECVQQMLGFRRKHIGLAISYITTPAKKLVRSLTSAGADASALKKKSAVGTGGSAFRQHLMRHVTDTRQCLYELRDKDAPMGKLQPGMCMPDHRAASKYVLPGLGPLLPKGSVFGRRPVPHVLTSASSSTSVRSQASPTPQVLPSPRSSPAAPATSPTTPVVVVAAAKQPPPASSPRHVRQLVRDEDEDEGGNVATSVPGLDALGLE